MKELYKMYLIEMIKDNDDMRFNGNYNEAIYIIDDIVVGGGFYDESRTIDHFQLLERDYKDNTLYFYSNGERLPITWDQIIKWGVIVVPETTTYISDVEIDIMESVGFERLPLDDNHIKGYK